MDYFKTSILFHSTDLYHELLLPTSLSRASTMQRSTWVGLETRPFLWPRRLWCWGCLCGMLLWPCRWIRRSTWMGQEARDPHQLIYTKEGKKVMFALKFLIKLVWRSWKYNPKCFFYIFFYLFVRNPQRIITVEQKPLLSFHFFVKIYL